MSLNAAFDSPESKRRYVARLYEVDLSVLPLAAPPANPVQVNGLLIPRGEREFETSGDWCNMDAGACAYVDSNQQLVVYSIYHFLAKPGGGGSTPILKSLEFRATDFAPVALIEDGWVELYEQPRLGGRRLSILGPWNASIADTRRAYVDDKRFETARSIRYRADAVQRETGILPPAAQLGGGDDPGSGGGLIAFVTSIRSEHVRAGDVEAW